MAFSDVSLFAYMNQTDTPLASTRGHLMDHYGLRVADLDAWIAKLRARRRDLSRAALHARATTGR